MKESRIQVIVNNGIDRSNGAKYARRVELAFTLPVAKEPAVTAVADTDTLVTDIPPPLHTDTTVIDCTSNLSPPTIHSSLEDSSFKESSLSCPRLALRTNLLYDLSIVPNVGVEWFANEHWSVAANVMYIWMKNDMRHRY